MGRGKDKDRGQRKKRRRSHRRDDSESEDSDTVSSDSSGDDSSESDTDDSSSSEEERERQRRREKKKRRRSSDASSSRSKHRSKTKKEKRKHHKPSKAKRRKTQEVLSMDDYFRKSVEFRMWLSEEKGIFFSDLSSEESRSLFKQFAKKWNDGLLKKKYYQGVQSSALEHGKQTGHVWKFSKSLDQKQLAGLRESVSMWTSGSEEPGGGGASVIGPHLPPSPTTARKGPLIGPSPAPSGPSRAVDSHLLEEGRREERDRVRRERKEMRKHHETVLDELLPKATGREARLEKKRIRAEKRRDREISPDVAESTLMGPRTDIQAKIRSREVQRHSRAQAAAEKVAEIQAKERSKMQALLELAKASKKEGALW